MMILRAWTTATSARCPLLKRGKPLPSELMPITMGVFSQMLGEGIAMSSLAFTSLDWAPSHSSSGWPSPASLSHR